MAELIIAVARAIEDPARTHAPMDGATDTSGSATSTEDQTEPWTRSACTTRAPLADHASAPPDALMAAAEACSRERAPLSSDLTVASWAREKSPKSALGLPPDDSGCPAAGTYG